MLPSAMRSIPSRCAKHVQSAKKVLTAAMRQNRNILRRGVRFENLEDRRMLATVSIQATSLQDDLIFSNNVAVPVAPYSLREALVVAGRSPGDTYHIELEPNARYELHRQALRTQDFGIYDEFFTDLDIDFDVVINGNGATIDGNDVSRIFEFTGAIDVTINDLTIVDGLTNYDTYGGAIRVNDGVNLTLNDVHFSRNIGFDKGGALYADNPSGSITINGGSFRKNEVNVYGEDSIHGGAIAIVGGTDLSIEGTLFESNKARAGSSETPVKALGGAISTVDSNLNIQDALLRTNRAFGGDSKSDNSSGADSLGGAIFQGGSSTVLIASSRFESNEARGGRGFSDLDSGDNPTRTGSSMGGAIFVSGESTSLEISKSRFTGNESTSETGSHGDSTGGRVGVAYGGAIAISRSGFNPQGTTSVKLFDSIFELNVAEGGEGGLSRGDDAGAEGGAARGGGLFADTGTVDIYRTYFIENATRGGRGGNGKTAAGDGGLGEGGAIYTDSVPLYLEGDITASDTPNDPSSTIVNSMFAMNIAEGGNGGEKLYSDDTYDNDRAGDGGDAAGGAVYVSAGISSTGSVETSQVVFRGNEARAGNGGAGRPADYEPDHAGTAGGSNGNAYGGALAVHTGMKIAGSAFSSNTSMAGRIGDKDAVPFAGGAGGTDEDFDALRGGNGGDAAGGAVFHSSGPLAIEETLFIRNSAYASAGGSGSPGAILNLDNEAGKSGNHGGQGGDAFGGAIRSTTNGDVTVSEVILLQNKVLGGRGGTGGTGAGSGPSKSVEFGYGGHGGSGGDGGDAAGGGLSISRTDTNVSLTNLLVSQNKIAAGDGGFAGNGGVGSTYGGSAGDAGNGGDALGGGVHFADASVVIETSTIDNNVASSGWGMQGGFGGTSQWGGGQGGQGGDAGDASGGGIAIENGQLTLSHSTVVDNTATAGFGGNGGFSSSSEVGYLIDGADAGDGGDARGGGVYGDSGSYVRFVASTVARNVTSAGESGLPGQAGRDLRTLNVGTNDILNYRQGSEGISAGSSYIFDAGYVSGSPTGELQNSIISGFDGAWASEAAEIAQELAIDLGTAALTAGTALAAGVATGAAVGGAILGGQLLLAVGTTSTVAVVYGGPAILGPIAFSAAINTSAIATGALGAGFAAAVVTLGAAVLIKIAVVAIIKEDLNEALEESFGPPGGISGLQMVAYWAGGLEKESNPFDDTPPNPDHYPAPKSGKTGTNGQSLGQNVFGDGDTARSIIAAGNTLNRQRSFELIPANGGVNSFFQVTETVDMIVQPDVHGSILTNGTNLIGATNSPIFASDLHGTPSEPLDPLLHPVSQGHGGLTPTLGLLPFSPARDAIAISGAETSQNAFSWNGTADIGAWGGPANGPVVPGDDTFSVPEDGWISIAFSELLQNDVDPDKDPLSVTMENLTVANGYLELHEITDIEGKQVPVGFYYRPEQQFHGQEILTYQVSDSEFTREGTITINVASVNDAPTFTASPVFVQPNSGAHDIAGWASFDSGDSLADGQAVLQYHLSNLSQAELFTQQPTIDAAGTLHFAIKPDVSGTASFDVFVQDDGGTELGGQDVSGVQSFQIDIGNGNRVPSFVAPTPNSVLEDAGLVVIPNWASFDAGSLAENGVQNVQQYDVTVVNPQLFSILPSVAVDGTLSYQFAEDAFGVAGIHVTVQDDGGTDGFGVDTSPAQTFALEAKPVNDAPDLTVQHSLWLNVGLTDTEVIVPSFIAALPQNLFEAGQNVTFTTLPIQIVGGPVVPFISAAGNLYLTFPSLLSSPHSQHSLLLHIQAKDDGGSQNGGVDTGQSHTVFISIANGIVAGSNNPPKFDASDVQVNEDAGATTVSDWANFHPGHGETGQGQSAAEYTVELISRPELFEPGKLPTVNQSGDLIFTPAADAFGETTITVSVRDDAGATRFDADGRGNDRSISKTFKISINPVNDTPAFTADSLVSVVEDSGPQTIAGWVSEFLPDANPLWIESESPNPLAYELTGLSDPSLFSIPPTVDVSGDLHFTPAPDAFGITTFMVSVTDSDGGANNKSAPQTFTISVEPKNDRPTLFADPLPAVIENDFEQEIPNWLKFTNGPNNESDQQITSVAVTNISNPGLFEIPPTVGTDGTLHYRLAVYANGGSSFDVTAQDDGGTNLGGMDSTLTKTFTIHVTPVNQAPDILAPSPVSVPQNSDLVVLPQWATLTAGPSNESGQSVTVSHLSVQHSDYFAVQPTISADGSLSFQPEPGVHGTATIAVVVKDDGGIDKGGLDQSAIRFFDIQIEPEAPEIESFVVDDGSEQRSSIKSLTVYFKNGVSIDSGAISVRNTTTGQVFNPSVLLTQEGRKATLTFSGTGTATGSLPDGNYTITFDRTKVRAGDALMEVVHTAEFFRYYGDIDGDRDVDSRDFRTFKSSYRKTTFDAEFIGAFDSDGDGDLDARDFQAFRTQYRTKLTP